MGDFNINVLDCTHPLTQRFRDILTSFGLNWSVNSPTRISGTTSTAIDNVVSNISHARVSVLDAAISDHFALEVVVTGCSLDAEAPPPKIQRVTRHQNIVQLKSLLGGESWSFLDHFREANEMYTAFNERLVYYLDISCPFKKSTKVQNSKKSSWITQGILTSREKIKFYHSIFIRTENENFKNFFRNYRRVYRRVIKAAKAYDIEKTLKSCENFSKTAWSIINRSSNLHKSLKKSKPIKIYDNGKKTEDPSIVANSFNKYFSSVSVPGSNFKGPPARVQVLRQPVTSMALTPVDEDEVARVLNSLTSKKTCDIHGMSSWLLKQCSKQLLAPLTKLVNLSFETGTFPEMLKIAKIIPIFKNYDPCLIVNYRPISILPTTSKLFEKIFLARLDNFISRFEILDPEQYGFRKNKSTVDAVTKLLELVVDGLERREHVLSIFLDLSKAFDCVHHETLLHQLEICGIRGLSHRWISSYLRDRTHCVQIENILSDKTHVTQGVPQGSILGPVLFNLYVNGLKSSIQHGNVIQYADDTTLCVRDGSAGDLEVKSFVDLNQCIQHFSEISLQANNSKSNVIKFCLQQRDEPNQITVMVDDVLLEETESTKFLGIHLDRGLTWDDHIDSVCSRVNSGIYALRNLSHFCSLEVLKTAYFGLIHTHLAYGIRLWGSCSKYKLERVFRLQKRAVRTILKLNVRESCREAFRELGLLTLPCLYILEVALYCKSKCALTRGRDVHSYETRGRDNYRTQQHRSAAFERLPSQVGVKITNRLPDCIKNQNQNLFKTRLKRLLVSNAFYTVEEFFQSRWDNQ